MMLAMDGFDYYSTEELLNMLPGFYVDGERQSPALENRKRIFAAIEKGAKHLGLHETVNSHVENLPGGGMRITSAYKGQPSIASYTAEELVKQEKVWNPDDIIKGWKTIEYKGKPIRKDPQAPQYTYWTHIPGPNETITIAPNTTGGGTYRTMWQTVPEVPAAAPPTLGQIQQEINDLQNAANQLLPPLVGMAPAVAAEMDHPEVQAAELRALGALLDPEDVPF